MVLASARPDLSLGYKYDAPKDTYVGSTPDHVHHQEQQQQTYAPSVPQYQQPQQNYAAPAPAPVQQQQYQQEQQYVAAPAPAQQHYQQQQQSFAAPAQQTFAAPAQQAPAQQQYNQGQQTFAAPAQSVAAPAQSDYQNQPQAPIVTKHYYVHAAPEEPEENQGPKFVHVGRPQKNYKIIFIKAPSYGLNSQVIPIVPQNEEKTIVYVLSKKPEFNQAISLPPAPVTEPSKPEVFFIKYKTDQEAQDAQQKIQNSYDTAQEGSAPADGFVGTAISGFGNTVTNTFGGIGGSAQSTFSGINTGVANTFAGFQGIANSGLGQAGQLFTSVVGGASAPSQDEDVSVNFVSTGPAPAAAEQKVQSPPTEYLPAHQH